MRLETSSQILAMPHPIDEAALIEELGSLEALEPFLTNGLFDDPRTGKPDEHHARRE